ncbi:MAG TPA: CDP-alcohol phosphatidyltransferase family protein [Gemmatimonadaceae bacterium]|nr:CDP-alcohol phosphatidyltransferase family protein [Gemmatimonadaceae bacterium]
MNLPNTITVSRIVAAPAVAMLPFAPSWSVRLGGFVLFIAVAVSDYYDGKLARSRNLVTDLGRLLDPLADKLLLLATFVPMYLLAGASTHWSPMSVAGAEAVRGVAAPLLASDGRLLFPFATPFGAVGLPLWVLVVVLGRELFMTIFRQMAARRGVIISAIGPAKWKTGFQWTWVGSAFFWFAAGTAAIHYGWSGVWWRAFAWFNGIVGVVTMIAAVLLTLYSLALYMRRYAGRTSPPAVTTR